MLDVRKIAALPMWERAADIKKRVLSYPFYVLYGLGADLEFKFENYVSHLGNPKFIVDKRKGGGVFGTCRIVSSLDEIPGSDYCVVISAPLYAEEIWATCREYVSEEAIIPYMGELLQTGADYPRFLSEHEGEIRAFHDELSDDASRRILEVWLMGKVTKDVNLFLAICTPNTYMNASFIAESIQRFAGYDEMLPVVYDRTTPYEAHFQTGLFNPEAVRTFYDIGAAYGDSTAGYFRYGNPLGRVVAVEPSPAAAKKLSEMATENGWDVSVKNSGVSDKAGTMIVDTVNTGGSSIGLARMSPRGGGHGYGAAHHHRRHRERDREYPGLYQDGYRGRGARCA